MGLVAVSAVASPARTVGHPSEAEYQTNVCRPVPEPARRTLTSLGDVNSIGVAYFAGRSRGGDDAHLAAALTTELANQLLSARTRSPDPHRRDADRLLVVKLSEGGGFADVDLSLTGSVFRDET